MFLIYKTIYIYIINVCKYRVECMFIEVWLNINRVNKCVNFELIPDNLRNNHISHN